MQDKIYRVVNKLSTTITPCSFIYFRLYLFSLFGGQQRRRRLNFLDDAKKSVILIVLSKFLM